MDAMGEARTSQKGKKEKRSALLFESRIMFNHILNQEIFITGLRCHRTRRRRVSSGRARGKHTRYSLENRGAIKHKAAAGGGV